MKHTARITFVLIALFLISQIVGLAVTYRFIDSAATKDEGKAVFKPLPYSMERPPLEEKTSFLFIIGAIILGTIVVLLLIRFKKKAIWKVWYLLALVVTLAIALTAFTGSTLALILSIIIAAWKVFRPNVWVHNLTEVFTYGGLAAIFVPLLNVWAAAALLILISVYDIIAVNKLKHMVTLAKYQTKEKLFAGLMINYTAQGKSQSRKDRRKGEETTNRTAILGGGDIGFPLLFSGTVLKSVIAFGNPAGAFLITSIISITATIALSFLLVNGQKGKFYPAMPTLTAGCFLGYSLVWLIGILNS
ncbi:hypothetical protein HYU13_03045 [Candidatus Woesearchaeota archaeon]|nr:hypothetical protein [Candidatus Woesearchaeota archaeon]